MTKTRNPYLPIPKTAAQIALERAIDRRNLLAQRRAFLASGECTAPAIRAEIERQIWRTLVDLTHDRQEGR